MDSYEAERPRRQLAPVDLAAWRRGVQGRTIRDFVAHRLRRQTADEIALGINGLTATLPPPIRGAVTDHSYALILLAHARESWDLDCVAYFDAAAKVIRAKLRELDLPDDEQVVFTAFEVMALHVSLAAAVEPAVYRASGIAKRRVVAMLPFVLGIGAVAATVYVIWAR
jgi:hypothetical protein